MANTSLAQAKDAKNDEFYTELTEIQAEISNYIDKFKDKVVFCNCDDPFESNFVKYFLMNFNWLGLKELIATGYKTSTVGGTEIGEKNTPYALRVTDTSKYLVGTQKDLDIRGAKYFLQTEGDKIMTPLIGNPALDENGEQIQITIKEKYTDTNGKSKTKNIKQDLYYEAGDFRSDMSLSLLKQADVVVTNPPFSLFREYISILMQYQKQFLILGSMNAITYKEFFPLLKNNKVWIGCVSGSKEYVVTETYAKGNPSKVYKRNNTWYSKLGNTGWFTNIDHAKRHQKLPLDLGFVYKGHEDMYPKYDNYDAINVDKVAEIPCDYEPCWYKCPHAENCKYAQSNGKEDDALCESKCNGEMGVPISFLDKHSPEQFEIVGNGGSYKGEGSVAEELFVPCSQTINVERERTPQGIQESHHSQDAVSVVAFLECQSHSLISSAQSNSELSDWQQATSRDLQESFQAQVATDHTLAENCDTEGFLYKKCNGVMGGPISFLEKYCPQQFEVVGMCENLNLYGLKTKIYTAQECKDKYFELFGKKGTYDLNAAGVINGKKTYQRVLIQRKGD